MAVVEDYVPVVVDLAKRRNREVQPRGQANQASSHESLLEDWTNLILENSRETRDAKQRTRFHQARLCQANSRYNTEFASQRAAR